VKAPSRSRILLLPLALAATLLGLDGCVVRHSSVPHIATDLQPLPPPRERAFAPSFDCNEAASTVQDMVCGSPMLSGLDKELATAFRRRLREADLIGRDQLLATERHWLVTRRSACAIPAERQQDRAPDPQLEACLAGLYRQRIAAVAAWSAPLQRDALAPIAAYVEVKGAEYRDPGLCTPLAALLEAQVQHSGAIDPAHLPELTELAGTHGPATAELPFHLAVGSFEGGADQSYAMRARAVFTGDAQRPAFDQAAFTRWIKAQPNAGGRFSLADSDAKDFAAIDIIRYQGRLLALAVEPWGYYSPAAIGEFSYAGVVEILGPGQAEPRCLYKTYQRPPVHGEFDTLANFGQLTALLDGLQGVPPDEFVAYDRRETSVFDQELRWSLLNQPLIGTAGVRQGGWAGWLHHRQDATLEALFAWSERDLPSKILYRRLIQLMQPAQAELVQTFQRSQGLNPGEAQQAAELVLLELVEHRIGTYPGSAAIEAASPASLAAYRQRFPTAPAAGDLEAGRPIRSLHSAVLNNLPEDAIEDYVKYEFLTPGHARSTGAAGETALMAAVEQPETVTLLLQAGADPNEANQWRKTPLMAAAQLDQAETVRRLLDAHADVAAATIPFAGIENGIAMFQIHTGGRTALMYAAGSAHPALVRLLFDRGAKAADRDSAGRTACDYLRDNAGLTEAERKEAAGLLCR
jgi:uncharacterized protein YecT (DUF1311 family)